MSYINEYQASREKGFRRHIKVDIDKLHEVKKTNFTRTITFLSKIVFKSYMHSLLVISGMVPSLHEGMRVSQW